MRYCPPQNPFGIAATFTTLSTIGASARPISSAEGETSFGVGFACAAAAAARAATAATAHTDITRAEGERPARPALREWRVGWGSFAREVTGSKLPPGPKTPLRRP